MKFYPTREAMYPEFVAGMTCVEVGVQKGLNAQSLLDAGALELFLVDPWKHFSDDDYLLDPANYDQSTQDHLYGLVLERFRHYILDGCVKIHRLPSLIAAGLFDQSSVDVLYLDANHTYEAVYADLMAWEPVIKPAGHIMLHDFVTTPEANAMQFGVFDAAVDFMRHQKWKPVAMSKEGWDTLAITRQ